MKINKEILEWIYELCQIKGFLLANDINIEHGDDIIEYLKEKAGVK